MATIEPRLIHLLNDSSTPQLSSAQDLPPLHALSLPAGSASSSDRPIPPLGPDARHRTERLPGDASLANHSASSLPNGLDDAYQNQNKDDSRRDARSAGTVGIHPLHLLLSESDDLDPSHSSRAWEDTADPAEDGASSKRPISLNERKDELVHLPQPLKKQKVSQQAPVMPPIISGLHEPPPHAALFPPIASSSTGDHDSNQIKLLQSFTHSWEESQQALPSNAETPTSGDKGKNRKRAAKPRRKWTEEETNHLLLGVNRHGVGKWTNILEDPDFKFQGRTAGDLKDRFRTCCPNELLSANKPGPPGSAPSLPSRPKSKPKKGLHSENILIDDGDNDDADGTLWDNESAPRKKSRAHRKKLEDLAELGICGPFKKSHRRERRPFTERDDREILDGLELHGPAWTKIHRDSRFHLSTRQPTDLRDRVRNKYPELYQRIEKASLQAKEGSKSADTLAPITNQAGDGSVKRGAATMEPQAQPPRSRDEMLPWPSSNADSADGFASSGGVDLNENAGPQLNGGEMDISRLLLDDSRLPQ